MFITPDVPRLPLDRRSGDRPAFRRRLHRPAQDRRTGVGDGRSRTRPSCSTSTAPSRSSPRTRPTTRRSRRSAASSSSSLMSTVVPCARSASLRPDHGARRRRPRCRRRRAGRSGRPERRGQDDPAAHVHWARSRPSAGEVWVLGRRPGGLHGRPGPRRPSPRRHHPPTVPPGRAAPRGSQRQRRPARLLEPAPGAVVAGPAAGGGRRAPGPAARVGSRTSSSNAPTASPAASSSGWRWPGCSSSDPIWSWPTSRCPVWTRPAAPR